MKTFAHPGWEIAAALGLGLVAGIMLPPSFFDAAVSELVTILGIVMAALIPAMMLGATAVRAGGFSVKKLRTISSAIDRQISVFGGLFLYSLAACSLAVLGKLVGWRLPSIETGNEALPVVHLGKLFPGLLTMLFVFLVLRSIEVIQGVRSILKLSSTIAIAEAQERDRLRDTEQDDLADYRSPSGYGSRLNLPN